MVYYTSASAVNVAFCVHLCKQKHSVARTIIYRICDRAVDLKPSARRSKFLLANPEVNITMVPLDKKPVGIVPFANTCLLNTLKHVVQQGNLHR